MSAELEQARKDHPGYNIPDMQREPDEWLEYWRRLALWAYKYGPYLLDAAGSGPVTRPVS